MRRGAGVSVMATRVDHDAVATAKGPELQTRAESCISTAVYMSGGSLEAALEHSARALAGYDSFHGTKFANGLPRNPDGVLNLLDNYLRLRLLDHKKIAVVVDFAETITPSGDSSGMRSSWRTRP